MANINISNFMRIERLFLLKTFKLLDFSYIEGIRPSWPDVGNLKKMSVVLVTQFNVNEPFCFPNEYFQI